MAKISIGSAHTTQEFDSLMSRSVKATRSTTKHDHENIFLKKKKKKQSEHASSDDNKREFKLANDTKAIE